MAEPIGGSDASSFNLQWLWLLLLLGLTAIIIAVVMVCKKKAKASLRSGAPSAFRRESVNSLYGVTPETRKTSVNSLYGTDMGTSEPICSGPNPIYANDARQNAAGQGVSGGRNDAVETNTRSWVDPKEVNAYYSVDSSNYEPMSPDARGYYNKC